MNEVRKHTILCIDDDEDDLELLEYAFKSTGSELDILKAHNGREGITKLQQLKNLGELPCMIVLDLNMPGLNGKETFSEIKKDADLTNIPVIILSTSILPKDRQFFSSGNVECVTKPIEFNKYNEVASIIVSRCQL